ncbi:MAG: asparagine synthase-related protein [Dysosmobacter sp.]
MVWHTEGLCGLSLLGVKALLEQVRSQAYKVVLNGQCGDELMLGMSGITPFISPGC